MSELTPLPSTPIEAIPSTGATGDSGHHVFPSPELWDVPPGEVPSTPPEDVPTRPDTAIPAPPNAREPDRSFREQTHTWYGTDGSVWPLTSPETGIFLVQESIEGLHMPLTDDVVRESPSIAGGSFHGYRVKPRNVVWALYIYSDESSEAFYDLDRRFFKSVRMGKYGTWRVALPDGSYRELSMRHVPSSVSYDRDPGRFGWFKYPIQFIADEDPFWRAPGPSAGTTVGFTDGGSEKFLGEDGESGPPLNISPSSAQTTRSIFNDGDEPAYARVIVDGPMDYIDFSIGDRSYSLQCDIDAGEQIVVDTDPRTFSVKDSKGANRIRSLSSWIFEPLPEQEETDITMTLHTLGGGSAIVEAPPLYHRAW